MRDDMNNQEGAGAPSSMLSALRLHSPRPAPASERVSVWQKAAYGLGGLTDFLYPNTVNALAIPIYSIALGMDPLLLGIAMAVPRVVGAISDPLAGTVSEALSCRMSKTYRRHAGICL